MVHLSAMYVPSTHCVGALGYKLRVHREQGRQFHSVGEMGTRHGNQRTKQDRVTGQCLGGGGENNDEVMKRRLPGEAQREQRSR